jgi:hypothetical protein
MGSTLTGPMFDGGDATCAAGQYKGQWDNRPTDESESISHDLRQGGVKLICSCGDLLRSCSAPRLRTKW